MSPHLNRPWTAMLWTSVINSKWNHISNLQRKLFNFYLAGVSLTFFQFVFYPESKANRLLIFLGILRCLVFVKALLFN